MVHSQPHLGINGGFESRKLLGIGALFSSPPGPSKICQFGVCCTVSGGPSTATPRGLEPPATRGSHGHGKKSRQRGSAPGLDLVWGERSGGLWSARGAVISG